MKAARDATRTVPSALEAYIESERRRADVAGASVAAFDRDGLLFSGGYGFADLERGEPVTPATLFRAASITKLFTTTLVFQEIDAGRLSLDDPANRHLDGRSLVLNKHGEPAEDVAVRHLLTHTSGLPVSWRSLEYTSLPLRFVASGMRVPRTLSEIVAGLRTIRAPGRRIVYSNDGFCLLGYVVQRLNGRPFHELLRDRVLNPLGMPTSDLRAAPTGSGIATPYGGVMGGAGRRPAPAMKNWSGPAGALITSALELSRFGRMVLRGGELDEEKIVSPEILAEGTRFQARNHPDLDDGWGLGFEVIQYRGRRLTGHSGGNSGVSTFIGLLPEEGVGVVVLTNGGSPGFVRRVTERTFEALLGLEPERLPGSPGGIAKGEEAAWREIGKRAGGRYRLVDMFPPGLPARLLGAIGRPRLSALPDGSLVIEGAGQESVFLYPDGVPGRYRAASPMSNGTVAVLEERANGTHLWWSILHLFKPKKR